MPVWRFCIARIRTIKLNIIGKLTGKFLRAMAAIVHERNSNTPKHSVPSSKFWAAPLTAIIANTTAQPTQACKRLIAKRMWLRKIIAALTMIRYNLPDPEVENKRLSGIIVAAPRTTVR